MKKLNEFLEALERLFVILLCAAAIYFIYYMITNYYIIEP